MNKTKALKELRFLLCPNSTSSKVLRGWLNKNYSELKANDSQVQFLIRECENIDPVLIARYGK